MLNLPRKRGEPFMHGATIIHKVETTEKIIAFTFDDGPHPTYTIQLLDILQEVSGKATFFMIGQEMEQHRLIAEAVHKQGHEIGNHTYSHPALSSLTLHEVSEELQKTDEIIRSITSQEVSSFRPPYFDENDDILRLASEAGYDTIGALNLEARDWDNPGMEHIIDKSRETLISGSILIFHDGYGVRTQTVEAVRTLAHELTANGYRLVTIRELMAAGRN